ncbi:ATPase family AAA domain-containing protein, partial [Trifolium medium]|nr:ATPase family AAA domain-containing protein [Trifolium medium]
KSTSTSYKSSSSEDKTRPAKYLKILPIAEMDDSTPCKVPSLIGEDVWSTLVSQIAETPTIHVSSSKFTIGSDQSCSHVLQGRYLGRRLCKIKRTQVVF